MKKLWFGLLVVLVGILMTPAARVAASGAVHDDVGILTRPIALKLSLSIGA
ncbi:hypothetical protein [Lacticaseibacillus saniviri]|uniref:hypothetical protein n=1 Tax=Lacticaseibacillus saniviri TaxID=931533 RepID=UPI000A937134|nr:hypothetical protein [Lacticaseibacillus saniviri]